MITTEEANIEGQRPNVDAFIGDRVHQLMWRNHLSQTELARRLGVVQPTLSRKLRGTRPWFAGEIYAVAKILGVTPGALFGDEEGPHSGKSEGPGYERPKGFEPQAPL